MYLLLNWRSFNYFAILPNNNFLKNQPLGISGEWIYDEDDPITQHNYVVFKGRSDESRACLQWQKSITTLAQPGKVYYTLPFYAANTGSCTTEKKVKSEVDKIIQQA